MPVERFRSLDEARRAIWRQDGRNLVRRIRRLWALAARLAPFPSVNGVRKFRSIEEANRDRDAWAALRSRALRAQRLRADPSPGLPRDAAR